MRRALAQVAWREFVGGIGRFRIFLACLGVGAFAIASAGSITLSFRTGVTDQARMLLGGDVAFSSAQREANPEQLAWIEGLGRVSQSVNLRLMGETPATRKQVEVRAVDAAYPLMGEAVLEGGAPSLAEALAFRDGRWGVAVSQSFLDQLRVKVGDEASIGSIPVRVSAILKQEPDRLGEPGFFQPEAMMSLDAARDAGRLETGQLFRSSYTVLTERPPNLDKLETDAKAALGEDGLRMRRPADAVDGLQALLDLLNTFFSVVGVASLVAGGVGIAQATSAFLESRVGSIAALKAFGASAADIRIIYLLQLTGLALLGSAAGVALGALTPFALQAVAGDRIPLPQTVGFYPQPLLLALSLSMLAAAVFALPALGRARATPPAALFRRVETSRRAERARAETIAAVAAAGLLCAVATAGSPHPFMTLALLIAAAVGYGVLTGIAVLIRKAAKAAARTARGAQRLMLSNLGGPGSLAPLIAPALGLGLAVLTLVAVVQANLLRQISETAPLNAPSLVFSQIPATDAEAFDQLLADEGVDVNDADAYRRIPVLLARLTAIRGDEVNEETVAESERWVAGREIQVTWLADKPPEVELVSGKWWPADYSGPLLVSVEEGVADGMKLKPGDTLGFRIYGRNVEASVASIRRVDWGGFGINMPFVFSPGELSAARPQNYAIARAPIEKERPIIEAIGARFPDVVVFQTREVLATATKVVGDISVAVNAIASVVTIAGLLVLAGALATIARKRRVETALLKTMGATRARVLGLYAGEFAFAGAAGTLIGVGMGVLAAFPVVHWVFEAHWTFPWATVGVIAALAVGVSALGGGLVGLALLSQRPAQVLRGS
ncbi:MAG: FtsX-like permease family protein [Hyphomonadaceae bacterium]